MMTEVSGPDVKVGMQVVVGEAAETSINPFSPKPFQSVPSQPAAVPDERRSRARGRLSAARLSSLKPLPHESETDRKELLKNVRVVITADTLKIASERVTNVAFGYQLNSAANPRIIDLQTGGTLPLTYYGIYDLRGGELRICALPKPQRFGVPGGS